MASPYAKIDKQVVESQNIAHQSPAPHSEDRKLFFFEDFTEKISKPKGKKYHDPIAEITKFRKKE